MSRSGYTDDYDCDGRGNVYRGAVAQALRGARGQKALREIAEAMDAMQNKVLAAESLVTADGEFCTLGVLGAARGIDMSQVDPEDWEAVARMFDVAPAMVREVVWENDESCDFHLYRYVDVEICGPMRPHAWEDRYGNHRFTARVKLQEDEAGAARWQYMRDWVERHIDKDGLK